MSLALSWQPGQHLPPHTPTFPLSLCPEQTAAYMCPALHLPWACLQPALGIGTFKSISLSMMWIDMSSQAPSLSFPLFKWA